MVTISNNLGHDNTAKLVGYFAIPNKDNMCMCLVYLETVGCDTYHIIKVPQDSVITMEHLDGNFYPSVEYYGFEGREAFNYFVFECHKTLYK